MRLSVQKHEDTCRHSGCRAFGGSQRGGEAACSCVVGFYEVGQEDLETLPKLGLEIMEVSRVLIKGKTL